MKRRTAKRILLAAAALLVIAGAVFLLLPVREVSYSGNAYYSDAQLQAYIFGEKLPRYFTVRLREIFRDHAQIPFVERYELHFSGNRGIDVTIYEKQLAGYLVFQDYYLYFDWDGTIVEISQRKMDGIYHVEGLTSSRAVVGEKLLVNDENLRTILTIAQFVNEERVLWQSEEKLLGDLVDCIRFRGSGVSLLLPGITVQLGTGENMQEKLFLMADMLPELAGREGTLYLDNYREGSGGSGYIFK